MKALLGSDADVPGAVEAHFAGCKSCQERLEILSASIGLVSDFVAAIEPPDPDLESAPELLTAIENARTRGFSFSSESSETEAADLGFLDPPGEPGHLGRLGGFDVIELIAEGGMGLVFRGRDRDLERDIAIKVLSPRLAAHAESRELFLSEARAAASLDHENVLPIHLVETSGAIPFIVMPLVRGGTLHDRLRPGDPLEFESEILPISLAAARALAVAHETGLIHRDVKPANLMLEQSDDSGLRVWLADFGLARALEESNAVAGKAKTVAGTPHFLAPELLDGHPASGRSDLFALGAIFYAMAAGRLPFSGKTSTEIMTAIRESDPETIGPAASGIPAWYEALTRQLLARNPEDRVASAKELVAILEDHIESRRAAVIRAPLFRKFRRAAAVMAMLAALAAGTVTVLDLGGRTSLVNAIRARNSGEPFGLRGKWGVFPSLAEAVAAARGGATIEIFHDGRLVLPEVQIRGKSLTIEAARGFAPILVNSDTGLRLISIEDASLAVRHLTFVQNVSPGDRVRPAIRARRANLTLEHFAFRRPGTPKTRNNPTGIRRTAFVELIDSPEAVFRDGYAQARLATFIHVTNESAIPDRRIQIENCFIGGSQLAIFMGNPRNPAPVTLTLDRCTLFQRVPFLVTRNFGPPPVAIEMNHNIVGVREALLWAPTRSQEDLPGLVSLAGEGNVISIPRQRFINLNDAVIHTEGFTEGTPESLPEFRKFWNLPEGFARPTGELVPMGDLLPILSGQKSPVEGIEFSEASGLPESGIGADLMNIGPGFP